MATTSLKKNAFYSVLKAFMNIAFPVITFPYASRILTPDSIGCVNFSNSIVQYFLIFATLGIGNYGTREAAKIKDNKEKLSQFVMELFTINFISTLIAYLLFFICFFCIPKLFPYRTLLLISCTKILFTLIGFDWLYTAEEEFRYITLRSTVFQIISLFFLFIFVKSPDDTNKYALFGIIASVGSNVINFFYARKFVCFKITSLHLLKHLKPIFVFFGMTLVISIYTILDTSMLGFLSTNAEIGFYSVATKITNMVTSLLTAIIAILLPRLSFYVEKGLTAEFEQTIYKTITIMQILSIPIVCGLVILAHPIILLISGNQYEHADIAMIIMAPVVFKCVFEGIACETLSSQKKEKISLYACIAGATANIILNAILIPVHGHRGAAIGTLISQTVVMLGQIIPQHIYFFRKKYIKNILSVIFSTLIMSISVYIVIKYFESNIFKIVFSTGLGILIYALCLFLTKNIIFLEYLRYFKNKYFSKFIK